MQAMNAQMRAMGLAKLTCFPRNTKLRVSCPYHGMPAARTTHLAGHEKI